MQDMPTDGAPEGDEPERAGLRHRKKARQHASLLATALRLFREQGYDKVRMEDIAVGTDVATKTVYNYYPAKSDFLIEFLRSDRDRATPRYEKILKSAGLPVDAAIVGLMMGDLGSLESEADRAFWLEVMSVAVKARSDERFRHHRKLFTSFLARLLRLRVEAGELDGALDTELAADILHTIYSERFLEFCGDIAMSRAELDQSLLANVRLLLTRWLA